MEQKNRPHDSAFKQQRLKAWQPILTPRWVIGSFFLIGIIFIPIGIVLKSEADKAFESVSIYESTTLKNQGSPCSISSQNQGYDSIAPGSNSFNSSSCSIIFNITQDIPKTTTLQLYYQLSNFFQNHRRYVKSRSDDQLRNTLVMPATGIPSSLSTACDPSSSLVNSTTNLVYWPCGLIAQSYFNDGIILKSYNGIPADPITGIVPGTTVTLNTNNVAWPSDMDQKFYNPTGTSSSYTRFEFIWQKYDQMNCYSETTHMLTSCLTYSDIFQSPIAGSGCAKCPTGSYAQYQGGIQPPGGASSLTTSSMQTQATNKTSIYGVRTESFVVWMRTAGLPEFRKLYAFVTPPSGGFKKGDTLEIMIVPNFEVLSFGGTKSLVLSTVTSLGGKNDILGIAYVSVGGVCWALALAFMIKHVVNPRKLGDTKYIVWRQRGT